VEFDSIDIGQIISCPTCGNKLRLRGPKEQSDQPTSAENRSPFPPGYRASIPKPPDSALPAAPTPAEPSILGSCLLIAGVCFFVVLILFAVAQGSKTAEQIEKDRIDSNRRQAYFEAKQFILKEIVGARSVGDIEDSSVSVEGNLYTVNVKVDGLNAFGGPVRQLVTVTLKLDGRDWTLVKIDH
jgi:hypothetical protein